MQPGIRAISMEANDRLGAASSPPIRNDGKSCPYTNIMMMHGQHDALPPPPPRRRRHPMPAYLKSLPYLVAALLIGGCQAPTPNVMAPCATTTTPDRISTMCGYSRR